LIEKKKKKKIKKKKKKKKNIYIYIYIYIFNNNISFNFKYIYIINLISNLIFMLPSLLQELTFYSHFLIELLILAPNNVL